MSPSTQYYMSKNPCENILLTDLLEKGDYVVGAPTRIPMNILPVIEVGRRWAIVHRDCVKLTQLIVAVGTFDAQFTLEPPPRHWPQGTTGARPPRSSLSFPTLNLTVVLLA